MVSQSLMRFIRVLFLFAVGMAPGSVLALGPVDGSDLPPTDLERVTVGSPAPDFALEDESGTPVTLAQFQGKKNVVLVFYRGHW